MAATPRRRSNAPSHGTRGPGRAGRSFASALRLWSRLGELLLRRPAHDAATALVLAPRRLEPRRMLDVGIGALALETLESAASHEFVQTSADPALTDAPTAATADATAPPPAIVFGPSAPINENGVATLEFFYDVPGAHTAVIDWQDGKVEVFTLPPGDQIFSTTHQYLDDDPQTGTPVDDIPVTVRILGSGDPVVAQTKIRVNNVAPSNVQLELLTPIIDEGNMATVRVTFDDPGLLDTHSVAIDWDDGITQVLAVPSGARSFEAAHLYQDDNPSGTSFDLYDIRVRVIDDDLGLSPVPPPTATLTVNNVAPTNIVIQPLAAIDEHGIATLELGFDDPGTRDLHTVEVDWGDGSVETFTLAVGDRFLSTTHQYFDDNPSGTSGDQYEVRVRVLDDDSGVSAIASSFILVRNVAPQNVAATPQLSTIQEGGSTALTVTFSDPGTLDTHTYEVDWGDGVVTPGVVAAGSYSFGANHTYADNGNYTVTVRVRDDDTDVGVGTARVNVANVAPTLTVVGNQIVNEGSLVALPNIGLFTDPGFDNPLNPLPGGELIESFTYTVNWGDGTADSAGAATVDVLGSPGVLTAGSFDESHTFADDGVYTVTVTVLDDDGGEHQRSFQVTVLNVNPTLSVVADQTTNEGSLLSLPDVGAFTDPGFNNPLNPLPGGELTETFTFTVNWGDGTANSAGDATVDVLGSPGVLTAGSFDGSHTYADNGVYTVTVTVLDDDGGEHQRTFQVTVANVDPFLAGNLAPSVDEGHAFTLAGLGVKINDPGFDNPANAGNLANGGETEETFTGASVDWGDGTATDFTLTTTNRVSGSPGVLTTADFVHAPHTYADNGSYTVELSFRDDDGGLVTRTVVIVVNNVAPTLSLTNQQFRLNEGSTLTIPNLGTFTDPGFDNLLNAGNAANGGEIEETFTYSIDWGDGTPIETAQAPISRTSGSPGALTIGALADSHFYADNDADNRYTITVTLADDDGGAHVQSIVVVVNNVNPTLDPIAATDVNTKGETTLQLEFSDPGADSFEVLIDWGDKLFLPPSERFVVETVHAGPTPKSFTLLHTYSGPPDPLSPASDIVITVKIHDDDVGTPMVFDTGISNLEVAVITNPGIGAEKFRIDTTPQAPRLVLPDRPLSQVVLRSSDVGAQGSAGGEISGSAGDSRAASERFLELRIINPDGTESEGVRLPSQVLNNLAALFRNLPDNHYAIYLVQSETLARRLVIEVFVRNGKVIDPGDDSEGARDRPPTDESTTAPSGEEANQPAEADQADGAAALPAEDADDLSFAPRSPAMLRHGSALVGASLALCAAGRPWRRQVEEALVRAKPEHWKQLRTAGYRRRKPR